MRCRPFRLSCLLLLAACGADPVDDGAGKLAALRMDPGQFGAAWSLQSALVVPSWADVGALPQDMRAPAQVMAPGMQRAGITGVAKYSWATSTMPLDVLNVDVYRFGSEEALRTWFEAQWQSGRNGALEAVDGAAGRFVAKGGRKLLMVAGRWFVSAGKDRDGDEHRRALDAVAAQLGL